MYWIAAAIIVGPTLAMLVFQTPVAGFFGIGFGTLMAISLFRNYLQKSWTYALTGGLFVALGAFLLMFMTARILLSALSG